MTRSEDGTYALEYLLALFNSRLFQWRFKITSSNNNVGTNELESLPFRQIQAGETNETRAYDRLMDLATQIIERHSEMGALPGNHEKEAFRRHIAALDRQIDRLVYELYGLTDEEIRIVEEAVAP